MAITTPTACTAAIRTFSLPDAGSTQCKWISVHNPIRYYFQIGGDTVVQVDNTETGGIDIMIDSSLIGGYSLGDNVCLVNFAYQIYGKVTNIASPYITIEGTYSGAVEYGGILTNLTLKPNLKIEVQVYVNSILTGTAKFTPSIKQLNNLYFTGTLLMAVADISTFVQGVLKKSVDTIQYIPGQINEIDENNYAYFFIKWRETYSGSTDDFTSDLLSDGSEWLDGHAYYATKSVRQLQRKNGESLFEYVAYDDLIRTPKAKFITSLERPKYYYGYPFDLMYISPDLIYNDTNFNALFTPYSASGVSGTPFYSMLELYGVPSVQRLMVNLPFGDEGDWDNAAYFKVAIATEGGIFIEEITVDIINKCFDNPVYIKAKADNGNWDYFMFESTQELVQDSASDGDFNPMVDDLESSDTNTDFISKSSRLSIQLGANGIASNEFEAYKSLARSPKVYMLTNTAYPWTWQTVKPRNLSIKRSTRLDSFDFEMIIDLPDQYKMSN